MKPKILSLLLAAMLTLPVLARDFTYEYEGQTLTYTVIDEVAKTCKTKDGVRYTISGNKATGHLVLPAHPKDGNVEFTLTAIGVYSFGHCVDLESISIPSTVETIGNDAFINSDIKSAYFESLESFLSIKRGNAFSSPLSGNIIENELYIGGELVTEIVIPDTLTSIETATFCGCRGLTSVIIPNSVTSIGNSAFQSCFNLTSIEIPNSVTLIGEQAFAISVLKSIVIPNTVKSIENGTFSGCSFLTSIDIPNSITSIGSSAFSYCSSLTSIQIPNSVTSIRSDAFMGCTALTSIEIPNSVTTIDYGTFRDCSSLISIEIPSSVTTIWPFAFFGCSGLLSLSIMNPKCEVLYIKSGFKELESLKNAVLPLSAIVSNNSDSFFIEGLNKLESLTVLPFDNPVSELPTLNVDKIIAPENFKTDNENVCYYPSNSVIERDGSVYNRDKTTLLQCANRENIEIQASTRNIADNAVEKCSAITAVKFADSNLPISIGESLKDLTLSDIYIGRDLTSKGAEAINSNLKNISFGALVESIPANAFNGCEEVTSISLPAGIKSIGENAFANCPNLTSIESLAETAPTLAENSFAGLYATVAPVIPEGSLSSYINPMANWTQFNSIAEQVNSLLLSLDGSEGALAYAKTSATEAVIVHADSYADLTKVEIPATIGGLTVVGIDMNAFASLPNLTEVTLPATVRTVGNAAFYDCKALASVNLDKVATLGESAFAGTALTAVNLMSATTIGKNAFTNTPIASAEFGPALSAIGYSAFAGCPLTKVSIPAAPGLKIDNNAFANCANLTEFSSTGGLAQIGRGAFDGCTALTTFAVDNADNLTIPVNLLVPAKSKLTTVTLGAGVVEIGFAAFEGCSKIKTLTIGRDVAAIGPQAFKNAIARTGTMQLVKDGALKTIGDEAFSGMRLRGEISLPDNVELIGNKAFYSAADIESVILPANRKLAIGDEAFASTQSLTSVVFPETITSIGTHAFSDVTELTEIDIKADNIADEAFAVTTTSAITRLSVSGAGTLGKDAFKGLNALTDAEVDVPVIGETAFANLPQLKTVKFGTHIEAIRKSAFNGCAIERIELPYAETTEAVTEIAEEAFGNNPLNYVSLGNRVKSLAKHTFNGAEIDLGTSVETLSNVSIQNTTKLILPASLTQVGYGYFSVDSLVVPESDKLIEFDKRQDLNVRFVFINRPFDIIVQENANEERLLSKLRTEEVVFGDNEAAQISVNQYFGSAKSITVGSSVKHFENLSAENVSFSEGIETIGSLACDNAVLRLPASLKSIQSFNRINFQQLIIADGNNQIQLPEVALTIAGNLAALEEVYIGRDIKASQFNFTGFTNLQKAVVGDQVTSIPASLFKNCKALTNVVMSDNVSKIGSEAFYGCTGLEVLSLSENITTIGDNAYTGCTGLQKIVARGLTPAEGNAGFGNDIVKNVPLFVPDEVFDDYLDSDLFYRFDDVQTFGGNVIESVETEPIDTEYSVGSIFQLLKPIVKWFVSKVTGHAPALAPEMAMSAPTPAAGLREVAQVAAASYNNADFDNFYWFAPNPEIASVDQEGNVTINGEGKAEIWVYALDGSDRKGVFAINDPDALTVSGDFNGDKVVNSSDLQFLINHVLNPQNSTLSTKQADMSNDGIVNSSDIQLHINKILNK